MYFRFSYRLFSIFPVWGYFILFKNLGSKFGFSSFINRIEINKSMDKKFISSH